MAAEWYYARKGVQRGPVTEEELRVLIDAGEIRSRTLVWTAGMSSWQRLESSPAALSLPTPGLEEEGTHRCHGCGKVLADEELIQLRGLWVCAKCKPTIVQQLREGVPPLRRYQQRPRGRGHPSNPIPRRKTNAYAVAGLILGCTSLFFGCPPIAIVMAVIGLILSMIGHRQCREDPDIDGKGMAIGGMVANGIALLVYTLACVFIATEIM